MQKLIFLIVFLSLSFTLFAQNRKILTPDGKLHSINEGEKITHFNKGNLRTKEFTLPNGIGETSDTLRYSGPWNANFGFFGQDWMLMWFECPADLTLKYAGFATNENDDAMFVELKIVTVNSSKEDLTTVGTAQHGWYEAAGNHFNDITAFSSNPDTTGPWTSVSGGLPEPFGMDIWSDNGTGFPIFPVGGASTDYQWVDMSNLYEPEFSDGDIFGIAIKHTGAYMDTNRIGLWASGVNPQWGWKFYANGRTSGDLTTAGWWTRELHWNFRAIVEIGCVLPPTINFTQLGTTISTEPRLVEAEVHGVIPGGGGIDKVWLMYSTSGGLNWIENEMDGSEPNYSGYIPGKPAGTEVTYKVSVVEVNGNTTETLPVVYNIFEVQNPGTTLIVFNGYTEATGSPYPMNYYFGDDIMTGNSSFPYDVWAYGDDLVEAVALENYTNVFEIWNADQGGYNETNIRVWLEADGTRNYFLAGQEYLGAKSGYVDSAYVAGDFEYDILGIQQSYNDITYYYLDHPGNANTFGDSLGTVLTPISGTVFGDPLLTLFNSLDPPADSMLHNPLTILDPGDGSELNWQDAFDIVGDQSIVVDMNVETRGVGDMRGPGPEVQILPTLIHRELLAGNKIVFGAFDPLSVNTEDDSTAADFHWIGYDNANTPYQALQWFGIQVGVELEEKEIIPGKYTLSQNYPNPFNPTTTIRFTISDLRFTTLKVYDVLGNEVATLVNEELPAGEYEVEFNSQAGEVRNLSSGIYFYKLQAGSFVETKKMVLMK